MNNLTTKQKIVIGAVVSIMLVVIGIYGYNMLQEEEDWDQNLVINETDSQNETVRQGENGEVVNQVESEESNTAKIVIHITGAVQKNGILVLPEGSRIADAIDAAGGSTEQADLDAVNLAYVLQDGQKIYIPTKEDKAKLEGKAYISSGSGNNVVVKTANVEENLENGGSQKVNINTATQNELETLPGIGASIASRIIEYREQNGKFNKIEDLQNVKGIGEAKFANIKGKVVVK